MDVQLAFDALTTSIIGESVSYIWRGHGSAIFLEIGDLSLSAERRRDGSAGNPTGRVSLGVEWSWRIEDADSIICGSWSREELWSPAFERLREGRVNACRLFGTLPEIEVGTDSGLRFLSFSTTDGQPQWFLIDRSMRPTRSFGVRDGKLHVEV